ncbi:hypothetical protein BB560_002538 [Smittium megazygosporum]|uniref:Chloride channel protein n=1 Tax=Smittium megazygosporum TaxID=133381 RepID=A0A2T9ZEQ1_9FUNG|nr:hypothetical protein BB560_002538 [Smittium megazygosporum]
MSANETSYLMPNHHSYDSIPRNSKSFLSRKSKTFAPMIFSRARSLQSNPFSANDSRLSVLKKTRDVETGERIWYDSYTTIDWLGDSQKEQTRLRELMRKDTWFQVADRVSDWFLFFLVGAITGIVAGFIAQWTEILSDWKFGYCSSKWNLNKDLCGSKWVPWSSKFGNSPKIQFLVFCSVGCILSGIACQIVLTSATKIKKPKHFLLSSYDEETDPPKFAYYGAGSGIPEVKSILSGFVIHGFLGLRILLVKSFGLILSVASGIMAGKEGPFVHIASCIGNICSRLYPKFKNNESKKRQLISASAAAGVSVAFGAPIGGVLFSLEEVSYYFPHSTLLYSFFCALVAAIVLRTYDPFGTGKIVMFQVFYNHNYSLFEMPFFFLIGIFGGLWGALYVKLNSALNKLRKCSFPIKYAAFEVFIVTLATLSISYHNKATSMNLGQMVGSLFQECPVSQTKDHDHIFCVSPSNPYNAVVYNLFIAFVVRGFFAIITFGLKVPSGLVLPSMSIGAIFGRLVGTGVEYLAEELEWSFLPKCGPGSNYCVTPGVYALVGAGATLTGATRTTISVAVIMFELTESLTYTLPVMVAIITAKLVADIWGTLSIYDKIMDLAGYPFIDTKVNYVFTKPFAGDLVYTELPFINIDHLNTITVLKNLLDYIIEEGYNDGGIALVNNEMELIGSIQCEELMTSLSRISEWPRETICYFENPPRNHSHYSNVSPLNDFSSLVNQSPLSVRYNAPIELVSQLFSRLGASFICVEKDTKYYGIIPKKSFISYLDKLENIGMTHV